MSNIEQFFKKSNYKIVGETIYNEVNLQPHGRDNPFIATIGFGVKNKKNLFIEFFALTYGNSSTTDEQLYGFAPFTVGLRTNCPISLNAFKAGSGTSTSETSNIWVSYKGNREIHIWRTKSQTSKYISFRIYELK